MKLLICGLFTFLIGLSIWLFVPYEWVRGRSSGVPAEQAMHERVLRAFIQNREKLLENPAVVEIGASPGTGEIWIITDHPEQVPTTVADIPVVRKPAGVIILKSGGVQDHHPEMQGCPPQHQEIQQDRRRFCNPVHDPQPLPPPRDHALAGMRKEKAWAIFYRHEDELRRIPGVEAVSLGPQGILVRTSQPTLLPKKVEGLPVYRTWRSLYMPYRPKGAKEFPSKRMREASKKERN